MKIAALYARVSTTGQEKEETVLSQIAEIEERAKKDNATISTNLHFVDEGWTGELLVRPALDDLRDAVKNKLFEVLYVYDLGRLSRNFMNQLILKSEIMEAGIQIISLHDINADTDEGELAQGIMGLFHQYERVKIVERMRRGKLYKAKKGILFGWQAPYGYKYVKGKEHNSGKFNIIPFEADVIKKIYTWVGTEGLTVRQVIRRLYEEKIQPRKSINPYWSTSTLSRRLRDTTYIGVTYYNKSLSVVPEIPNNNTKYKRVKKSSRKNKEKEDWFAIQVPPIISQELFYSTQKQLQLSDTFSKRNRKHNYLLSGVIHCTCGNTRAGESGNEAGQLYYRCTDRVKRFPLPKECNNRGVNALVIDDIVWDRLSSLLSNKKLIKQQYNRWIKKQSSNVHVKLGDKTKLENKLKQLSDQEKRYLHAYGESVITLEQYKEEQNNIKLQRAEVAAELHKIASAISQKDLPKLPDLETFCGKMTSILQSLTFEKKQTIIRKIVQDIVTDGQTATIKGYVPLEFAEETNKENVWFKTEYRYRRTP